MTKTNEVDEFFDSLPAKGSGVKTPAEVAAEDALKATVSFNFKNKEDSSGPGFALMEIDEWLKFTVSKVEVKERPNYNDASVMDTVLVLTFDIEGRLDGSPVKDIDGQDQKDRLFWEWLNVQSTGFYQGKPSKTRACISALLGQDPEDEFKLDNIDDLVGKSCKAMFEFGTKKDGTRLNKVVKYGILK